jgi:hypothetical protein
MSMFESTMYRVWAPAVEARNRARINNDFMVVSCEGKLWKGRSTAVME